MYSSHIKYPQSVKVPQLFTLLSLLLLGSYVPIETQHVITWPQNKSLHHSRSHFSSMWKLRRLSSSSLNTISHIFSSPQNIPASSHSRTRFCLWESLPPSQCHWASLDASMLPTLHCKLVDFLHIQWTSWGPWPHLTRFRIPSILSSAQPPEGAPQIFDKVDPNGSKGLPIYFTIQNTLPFLILTKCKVRLRSLSRLCDWVECSGHFVLPLIFLFLLVYFVYDTKLRWGHGETGSLFKWSLEKLKKQQ